MLGNSKNMNLKQDVRKFEKMCTCRTGKQNKNKIMSSRKSSSRKTLSAVSQAHKKWNIKMRNKNKTEKWEKYKQNHVIIERIKLRQVSHQFTGSYKWQAKKNIFACLSKRIQRKKSEKREAPLNMTPAINLIFCQSTHRTKWQALKYVCLFSKKKLKRKIRKQVEAAD